MSGFAGGLRDRVTIDRPAGRDAIGAASAAWNRIGEAWAAVRPGGWGPIEAGGARAALAVWDIEMRDRDLAVGDRIGWRGTMLIVRAVTRDPATPDRLGAIGEERR